MTTFKAVAQGHRIKEPKTNMMIGLALQGIQPARADGDGVIYHNNSEFTAYDAGKAWGVSATTARRWLAKWLRRELVTCRWVEHRPGVRKRLYWVDADAFEREAGFKYGSITMRWMFAEYWPIQTVPKTKNVSNS